MAGPTFQTNLVDLSTLIDKCHTGKLYLPDFHRSWFWY